MAIRITDVARIPNISSGIYFREVDLTVVTRATGGFSGASICLTEKGPAFEISNSTNYEDRAFRLGELNPEYPSTYYAKQYLEQARNFKEVRMLGLEGYTDTRGFAIVLDISGSVAAVPGTSSLKVAQGALMAVLKERKTVETGRPTITSVVVGQATYTDPNTGDSVTDCTDYLFNITITYADTTTETITCSLRPESKEYIVKKFWEKPFLLDPNGDKKYPLIKSQVCPLWVDFVVPSVKSKPGLAYSSSYYLPGTTIALDGLPILQGNVGFGTNFTYQSAVVNNVVAKLSGGSGSPVIGCTVTVTGNITGWWSGDPVKAIKIANVAGTGNMTLANGTWAISNPVFSSPNTTFDLYDYSASVAAGTATTPLTLITEASVFSGASSPTAKKYEIPTWESCVLDFEDITYQTPITPWFVSDGDANGDYKKLFRFWSISDGESANTECKIEVKNINPAGNNGKGTFDIIVRKWDDRDDLDNVRLEAFNNLTMDPKNDNFITRRIGDGDEFPLRSRFIFIEMNTADELPNDSLPYGVLGYPNIAGSKFFEPQWTLEYDRTKPLFKQALGFSNNKLNTFREVAPAMLAYKSGVSVTGKGFHLNPENNANLVSGAASVFNFASQNNYLDVSSGIAVQPAEKTRRSRFIVDFYGGFDGWNVYAERTWGDATSLDYAALQKAVDLLADKENIDSDFTVLVTPDFHLDTHAAACELVLEMVRSRGDCLYIPDFSYDSLADVIQASDLLTSSNLRSSSTAVYFPWLQIEDSINKTNKWLPPSLLALGTISYTAMNENVWQPPGGAIRTVTNNLVRTRRRLKIEDREILKAVNINPITLFPGSGYEITEVRTTQEDFSALSFIHNRLLLCYAKKVLNQVLRPLLFQLNGTVTQDAFLTTVRPIFDRIKKLNGVEEYKVEIVDRPELNDRTTIYGRISIVPLYAVERIVIDFQLENSSVTFNQ
jgi:hypothetical protein